MCSDRMLYESRVRIQPFDELQLDGVKFLTPTTCAEISKNQLESSFDEIKRKFDKSWEAQPTSAVCDKLNAHNQLLF